MMAKPDFWEGGEAAQKVLKERSSLLESLSPWEEEKKALEEMEILLQKFPSGKWRPEAEYLIGVNTFRLKRFKEAADQFKDFWRRYPGIP
jgi:hypothetical protein